MESEKIPNSNRIFYYLGAVAFVLLLLWFGGAFITEGQQKQESEVAETEVSSENANYDDEAMWQKASSQNTAEGYMAYLELDNNEKHRQEAVEQLNKLLNKEGYVLFAEKENGTVGQHFFKYAYTDSGLPEVNDYLISLKPRPVYNGIPGKESLDQKDYDTVLENKIVLVEEVQETQEGIWLKVAYASQEVPAITD